MSESNKVYDTNNLELFRQDLSNNVNAFNNELSEDSSYQPFSIPLSIFSNEYYLFLDYVEDYGNFRKSNLEDSKTITKINKDLGSLNKDLNSFKDSYFKSNKDDEILSKLNEISSNSENTLVEENFKKLSDDLILTINKNNTDNISLLIGVIIGISIINIFFRQFTNKL